VSTQEGATPQTPSSPQPGEGKKSRAEVWAAPVLGFLGGIIVALIGLAGVVLVSDGGAGAEPPKITITNKDKISPEFGNPVKVEGEVENLGPGQTVWVFGSVPNENNSGIDPAIYAYPGPCPVDAKGKWTCPDIYLVTGAEDKDVGKKFKIFVSVLDDSDIARQIDLSIARDKGVFEAVPGASNHPPGVAEDSVVTVKKE